MFLSVVIPAYNCEKYIENCIQSVMTQDIDKSEYEVIIINDGSTDGTKQKCEELAKIYNNITLINTENHGQSHARNIGIERATGEYIEFVDSDDYIAHNMFGKLKNVSLAEDTDIIYFGVKTINEYGDYNFNNSEEIKVYESAKGLFAEGINNSACGYWVKRKLLIETGLAFVEGRFTEDGMFTSALFAKAGRAVFLGIDGYRYIIRGDSTVTKRERAHQKKMIEDFEFCVQYLNRLYISICKQTDNLKYLDTLLDQIGSYIFFLQIRMLKYGDYKLGRKVLKRLRENNLYPYKWEPYKNLELIYKLLNIKFVYLFLLGATSIKNKICGVK